MSVIEGKAKEPENKKSDESNFVKHTRRELELAGLFDEDSDYNGMIGEAVLELAQVFSAQGHSGFSAMMVGDIFSRLVKYETLTENDHSLNVDQSAISGLPVGTFLQCSRDPRWFSDDSGATWYNVDDRN